MKFSVVVPSYNSSSTIRQCLASLLEQQRPADEIIVVDSSDDETPAIIDKEFPAVTLIHLPDKTLPGPARNIGVEQASGDIIAFTDADCVAQSDWLAVLAELHQRYPQEAGIGGVVGMANPDSFPATIGYLLEFSEFVVGSNAQRKDTIPSCNLSFKRDVFERYGGFPQDLFPGEDAAFTRLLTEAGETLLLAPDVVVLHHNRDSWDRIYQHQYAVGHSFVASRRSEPALPGAFVLRHTLLSAMIPAVRWWLIVTRLWSRDRKLLWMFVKATPYVTRGLLAWYRGFRDALASSGEDSIAEERGNESA